ncbi:MAG: hypothetical protein WBX38_07625 [Candidatus Sulfotelmatobacter sp.]
MLHSSETVKQIAGASGHTVWQINQPTVNKASTDYAQITFSRGESITVAASGCVQTGGKGHTWKRYVDPADYGSPSPLYHGLISIPGATAGLVDYNPRQPTVYTIPANASLPANPHLQLGYTDDNYGDNGYSARNSDNGNLDQCKDLGDASIIIDIGPLPAVVPPPAEADYTFMIDSIMIRNPRTHHAGDDGTDTDVLGTSVVVNGTQSSIGGEAIGNVRQGNHSVNFPIVVTEVRPEDRLSFLDTVVNAGDPSSQATTTEVTGIIGKIATVVPVAGSVLSAVVTGLGSLINVINADCDGPVVADAIAASGSDLALWTQNGPYTRTMGFAGVNSATGCGSNSFYEVTYTIARSNAGPQPYSLQVNARSLASKLGTQTREFRH